MGKRLTFEEVQQYFQDQGCELLEQEYSGCKTKMKYECSCGNISTITFDSFKQGQRCMQCAANKRSKQKTHTFEYVEQFFKDNKCELLETEYINAITHMDYKCNCGIISQITFNGFQQGHRCKKCGLIKSSANRRHEFDDIYNFFKQQGCELLETEYKNTHFLMKYRCNCGNISKICFNNFKNGRRCKKCGIKKISEKFKFKFEDVQQYFKDQGCELLEKKYINVRTKMKYKCSCGDTNYITFYSFQLGRRCKKCGILKQTGKNNYNYNPNLTDEEREKNKSRMSDIDYKNWRTFIFIKDKRICQKCSQKGYKLRAHHIFSWATHPKLRFDKNNGITLCEDCHKKFHKLYGKTNNNPQQLQKYLFC